MACVIQHISKYYISLTMYRRGWLDREIYESGFKCYWILKTIGYHLISLDWIEYMQAVLDCDQKWGSTMISWRYIICPVMCAYDCAPSFQMIFLSLNSDLLITHVAYLRNGEGVIVHWSPQCLLKSKSLCLLGNVVGLVLVYLRGFPATAHFTSHHGPRDSARCRDE